ncbi:MAG: hypothetical protein WAV00_17535 [Nocardioides sp.]
MAPQHAYLFDNDSTLSGPVSAPARDHLSLVRPVYLTYADRAELRRTGPVWRREQRRFPAGLVHAAHLHSPLALCGAPLESLEAFGRSRHPFEGFDVSERCQECNAEAAQPTA